MKIIDLTQTTAPGMPVFPGDIEPQISPARTFKAHGFFETLLCLCSHTGTHVDAPRHVFPGGLPLGAFEAAYFVGTALVIDATDAGAGGCIGISCIEKNRELAERADFILFYTGWDKHWDSGGYMRDFPVISDVVADYLVQTQKRGIGLDTPSLDSPGSGSLPLHRRLLGQERGFVVFENLCNLGLVGGNLFTFAALPLKHSGVDGAPVRAIAIL
jgi:kynurenine formamidase